MTPPSLPIDAVLPELLRDLATHPAVVLQAPPGAGKTTRVPLALLNAEWLAGRSIVMLEPRRLAASNAARFMAGLLGETVGQTVGYAIRYARRISAATRIEVVTEGILTRRLQNDPELKGVGLVIFDEFHERNLHSDLALALCRDAQLGLRDDLKILVMSATLDVAPVAKLLGDAPLLGSRGRAFPVALRYLAQEPSGRLSAIAAAAVRRALKETTGDLLVFLPGAGEIRRCAEQLRDVGDLCDLRPLYGDLPFAEQERALLPGPRRRVVLATNIAETSLTIDGVRVVVDAGLERVPRFDPASGMTRLDTQRISRASATQRAGRAGRLEPGVCYRLWSQSQHEQLAAHGSAEILQADLAGLALQLARWGVDEVSELVWLDPPPAAALAQARELLQRLGALQSRGHGWTLTAHGQAMATLPAHPRLAHLLLRGQALGLGALAADLAALLSERDILRGAGADLHSRLALLSGESRAARGAQGGVQRARQLARQFRSLLPKRSEQAVSDPEHPRWLGCLLAFAYPDRIARQRRAGGADYRLANGRAAQFGEPDALMKHDWLVIADLGSRQGQREERIYLAADLDPMLFDGPLAEQVAITELLDWDEREGVLRAERQRKVGELVLSSEALSGLDEAARGRALVALVALVRRKGLELLPWTPELRQWQARIALLRRLDLAGKGDSEWPDVADAALLASLEDWLLPYLGKVSRLSHFAALDLSSILQSLLPWPLPQRLDELAPKTLEVPSGSRIRLDYSEEPPVLAVRLQELFGLAATPRIAGGRLGVKLHLLSPAQRPVQVTQDLASFWANTYTEVKKDLKGRYPKHYWPDDPLIAEPTARAKPRKPT
ncbi:MAG TPA: ATP-dependent helicase HrpB [Desulfuromonas sp.]|nr:ATP-dependent helicase HrpB [Desulfuromonas sp.]